ncbi:hypothetical protein [Calothrix rhizosoleniae]|uniref:hypothetical protein n=1 Tax=Calothrix rhizosoleniae TaxID=888997 RepID=UPI00135664B5|nr:hypothetical protein [Calothrix rhizosoleniae]
MKLRLISLLGQFVTGEQFTSKSFLRIGERLLAVLAKISAYYDVEYKILKNQNDYSSNTIICCIGCIALSKNTNYNSKLAKIVSDTRKNTISRTFSILVITTT